MDSSLEAPVAVVKTPEDAQEAARSGKWRKSHYSYDIGACAEVLTLKNVNHMRDNQNPDDSILEFDLKTWSHMVSAAL